MDTRLMLAITGVSLVVIYAIGSGLFVDNSGWYQSLNRPNWQPPDFVFGLIWPYNFLMLGIASVTVIQRSELRTSILFLVILAASVIAALAWAYFFYKPHNLVMASLALGLAAIFTIPLLIMTLQKNTLIGILLMPYKGWLITATFLSFSYSKLN